MRFLFQGSSVKIWGKEIDGYIVKMMTEEKAMQLLDEFLVCEISLLGTQLKGMTGNFQPATLQWFSTRHSNYNNLDHHLCADVTIISHTNKQVKHYLFSLFIYLICLLLCTIIKRVFLKKKTYLTIMWYIRHIVICNSLFQCGKQFGGGSSFGWINHLI